MRWFCACCLLFLNMPGYAQGLLKGIIVDSFLRKPLPNATVFLNGTSIGVKTNEQGRFTINIPPGRFSLVAINRGFESREQIIGSDKRPDSIILSLKPRPRSTEKEPFPGYTKSTREYWGEFFLNNVFGTSNNPAFCSVKNLESIHFYVSRDSTELLASTDEPLIIQNKFLGYTILYQIESFRYKINTVVLSYSAYTYFQPMQGGRLKQKEWQANRSEVYSGSMMHFMRSLYLNRLSQEGFEVRHLRKIPNLPDQDPVNNIQPTTGNQIDTANATIAHQNLRAITKRFGVGTYSDQVYNPDNYKDIIGVPLPGDSIAYAINKTTAALDFSDFLLVVYRDNNATMYFPGEVDPPSMTSELLLTGEKPIRIEANGSFYDRGDLLVLGYWSSSEKIPTMLPLDYVPPGR